MGDNEEKILFQLFQDEDDWPPFSVESIWSAKLESHVYRLNNVPYFAKNISLGDVIRTQEIDGQEWFLEVQKESANSTVHVFCFEGRRPEHSGSGVQPLQRRHQVDQPEQQDLSDLPLKSRRGNREGDLPEGPNSPPRSFWC